jgi:hypothetical protein
MDQMIVCIGRFVVVGVAISLLDFSAIVPLQDNYSSPCTAIYASIFIVSLVIPLAAEVRLPNN